MKKISKYFSIVNFILKINLTSLKDILKKNKFSINFKNYLNVHNLTSKFRQKLIEWMLKVRKSFSFSFQTFFRSITILDRYVCGLKNKLTLERFHLIGSVSLLIASKMDEVDPLTNLNVQEDLCHKRWTLKEILEEEKNISFVLNFDFNFSSYFNLMYSFFEILNLEKEAKKFISEKSEILLKLVILPLEFISKFSFIEIPIYVLIVSLKLFEHKNKLNIFKNEVSHLLSFLKEDQKEIIRNLNEIRIYIKSML